MSRVQGSHKATDTAAAACQASTGCAAAGTIVAATTAAAAGPQSLPAASGEVVATADGLLWQKQVAPEFSRIDAEMLSVTLTLDNLRQSVAGLRDTAAGGAP